MSNQDWTDAAVGGFMNLLSAVNNSPAPGTGINVLVKQAHNLMGPQIPEALIQFTISEQINLFGSYPTSKDVVPSAIFAAVFIILSIGHAAIFTINYSRGHYFWLSLGWAFYCVMRWIAWILRITWSKDITNTEMGIADEVLLVLPSILLISGNLILAQRIFTWRHPVGGSRKTFWAVMIALYVVVCAVIAMTIVASVVPYLYLISEHAFLAYKKVVEASSILIILYTLTAMALLSLAYFFKPTEKDENLYTFQPWWINSFSPLYFVKKGAAAEAADTFMKRNHNHRHAIRVIAATHHHYNQVEGLSNERGDLKHNYSLAIIVISSVFLFVGAICRAVAVFQGRTDATRGPVCEPVAMYICWGLLEVIINVLYLVGRVDLRFYRPDVLPKAVREIVTANQSVEQSAVHSEAEEEEEEVMTKEKELTVSPLDSAPEHEPNTAVQNKEDFKF